MEPKTYAYCRVSTFEQNEGRQIRAMERLNVPKENIYLDKQSGKNFDRPQYKFMVDKLKEGDLLYVLSIDRLGRNYNEIQEQWRIITKEKMADIVVINMPMLDTRTYKDLLGTFIADLVLQVLSFNAESEYNTIKTRQLQGIAVALASGVHFGRQKKTLPKTFVTIVDEWEQKNITLDDALLLTGMSRATFYRRLAELRREKEKEEEDDD